MADKGRYTADGLARRAGVPVRTVRYYVQEGLMEAPRGRGPGAHFDDAHLLQLERILLLRRFGFDLRSIRDKGIDIASLLHMHLHTEGLETLEAFASRARTMAGMSDTGDAPAARNEAHHLSRGEDIRIPMAEGVDLAVRPDLALPSPKDLVEIALLIRKIFGNPER